MTGFSASGSILSATSVMVELMVETWESACAKLGAEASVDGGAVKCSYLEPALPSVTPLLPSIAPKSNVQVSQGIAQGAVGIPKTLDASFLRTDGVRKDLPPLHVNKGYSEK